MAGFFSTDSKLYKFMERLTDVVKLNLLWLLFSLPIITSGAATIAVSAVTMRMAMDEEGHVGREFLHEFKRNLKQGISMTFLTIIPIYAIYLDFQLASAVDDGGLALLIFGIVSAYIIIFSLLYVYPLLARYENTIINSLKNSFRISMQHFFRSLLLLVLLVIEIIMFLFNYTTLFVALLIGPVFIIFTISSFAINIFLEIEKTPGTVRENNENTR